MWFAQRTESTENSVHNFNLQRNRISFSKHLCDVCNQNTRRWYIRFVCLFNFMIFDMPKKASIARVTFCLLRFHLVPTNRFYAEFYCSTNINTRDAVVALSIPFQAMVVCALLCRTSVSQCHTARTFTFYCVVDKRTSNHTLFTIWFLRFFILFVATLFFLFGRRKPKSTHSTLYEAIALDLLAFPFKWIAIDWTTHGAAQKSTHNYEN